MLTDKAKDILNSVSAKMHSTVEFLEEDLKTYRVGKANPAILNSVMVNYYGTDTPISQVASVTVPDARTIAIQPWERSLIAAIEKAIINANLGFTPQNNGEVIRCPIPPLTEERRKELIKKAKAAGENAKVAVRNSRRDGVESLKKGEKAGDFSEDDPEGYGCQDQGHRFSCKCQGKGNHDCLAIFKYCCPAVAFSDFFLYLHPL